MSAWERPFPSDGLVAIGTPTWVIEDQPSWSPEASLMAQDTAVREEILASSDEPRRWTSDRELGDTYLRLGDFDSAVRVYQRQLAIVPGDAAARRSLGLALLAKGSVREGFRVVGQAYGVDPGLASRPVSIDAFSDYGAFERLTDAAVSGASSENSAEGWLTAAVLLHSGGRHEAAGNAVERARGLGLDEEIARSLGGVIRR